jgi:hypothetical protein
MHLTHLLIAPFIPVLEKLEGQKKNGNVSAVCMWKAEGCSF